MGDELRAAQLEVAVRPSHLEHDHGWDVQVDGHRLVKSHVDGLILLDEQHALGGQVVRQVELVVGLLVHEDEVAVCFLIQVLRALAIEVGRVERVSGGGAELRVLTRDKVAHLDLNDRAPVARRRVRVVGDQEQVAILHDDVALAQFGGLEAHSGSVAEKRK